MQKRTKTLHFSKTDLQIFFWGGTVPSPDPSTGGVRDPFPNLIYIPPASRSWLCQCVRCDDSCHGDYQLVLRAKRHPLFLDGNRLLIAFVYTASPVTCALIHEASSLSFDGAKYATAYGQFLWKSIIFIKNAKLSLTKVSILRKCRFNILITSHLRMHDTKTSKTA